MLNTCPYDRKCPEYVGKEGQDYYFLANSCYIEIDTFVGGCPYPSYSAFTKYMTNRRDYIAQAVKNRFWEHVCFYNYLQNVLHTKRILDGHIGVLFYDVTTLYFEADYEDELRKTRFSKEGRHKNNIRYTVVKERPLPEKRAQNVLIDETVELELPVTRAKYPKRLRRIAVWNEEHQYVVEILTNNFSLATSTIAALYKAR